MISSLISCMDDAVDSATWINRYGGLATIHQHPKETGFNTSKNVSYPITNGVNTMDCWEGQKRYVELVPDDKYASIMYFHEATDMLAVTQNRFSTTYSQDLDLFIWANAAKLGLNSESDLVAKVSQEILRIFDKKQWTVPNGLAVGNGTVDHFKTSITYIRSTTNTLRLVESLYNYKNVGKYSLYPYIWISARINMDFMIATRCIEIFTPSAEITCYNLTKNA